ncbi:MAG: TIGR03086 family metal-binding protein [Acidimicrobiales bacterium]
MPETTTDRRPFLVRSYALAAEVAAGVRPDQLGTPTPCAQFDVATLVDHLVGAGWRAVALGRGEAPTGAEFPHVELVEAPRQLRSAGTEAEAAWAGDGTLAATTAMPWGETYTGATLVDMYLAEMAAHAWDLAAATGQLGSLDPALAGTALEAARSMLKPEYRDAMEPGSPFGQEVAAPDGASPWERLAAFMGREPRPWPDGPA